MKNTTREKNIIDSINLEKLPFKIAAKDIFNFTHELNSNLKKIFNFEKKTIKWCFSSQKKIKVFLIIFDANENIKSIYKEEIAKKLPEYSYKTVAQIVDDGVKKNFFIKLNARVKTTKDLKIRNVRPSEEVIIEFINWKIDLLASLMKFKQDLVN